MTIGKIKGISLSIKFKQIWVCGICIVTLSSCSSYSSSFGCGDAKGANCLPMDKVDKMIASGEIERFNFAGNKCKGRKCSSKNQRKGEELLQLKSGREVETQFINQGLGE